MFGQPKNNPLSLRVIKTARTVDAINLAAQQGMRPLVKAIDPSPKIHGCIAVYQNRKTGEITVCGDRRFCPDKDYDLVVPHRYYYQYSFPEAFAAYLIPSDLIDGERVWLEDVIEDIVAAYGNQGWHPRLESAEAVWVDGNFVIKFNPEKNAHVYIG
jgi:hypothetical protein